MQAQAQALESAQGFAGPLLPASPLLTYVMWPYCMRPCTLLLLLLLQPTAEARHGVLEAFKTEVQLLSACRDPHIVSFLGASLSGDFTLLVTEYCEGGSLAGNLGTGRVNWHRRGKQVGQLLLLQLLAGRCSCTASHLGSREASNCAATKCAATAAAAVAGWPVLLLY